VTRAHVDDEKEWWHSGDRLEPLIGVPTVAGAPIPLIDAEPAQPEPGLAPEQEDAESLPGFDAPPEP
jgi:hypothetical protein